MKKFIILALLVVLGACSNQGSSNNTSSSQSSISVSGVVSSGYTITARNSIMDYLFPQLYAISSSGQVDQVVAIPLLADTKQAVPENIIEAAVDRNGNFSLALTTDYDWLLLLTDSKATLPEDKITAYVTMTASQVDSMVSIPASHANATNNNLDLGYLNNNPSSQEAQSSNDVYSAASSFDLPLSSLLAMARFDDGYKAVINMYLNYNGSLFESGIQFDWDGGSLPAALANTEANPANYSYDGYRLSFTPPANTLSYSSICKVADALQIIPPASVDMVNQYAGTAQPPALLSTVTPTAPFNSSTNMTDQGGTYCFDHTFNNAGGEVSISNDGRRVVSVGVPVGYLLKGNPPAGWWRMKYQGQQIGIFDFETASPVDTYGNPLVFLPAPKIVTDAAGSNVTSIEVRWFAYDSTSGTYTLVNPADVNALVVDSHMELSSTAATTTDLIRPASGSGLITSATTFDRAWTVNGTDPYTFLEKITVGYRMGYVGYAVDWEPSR